MTHLTHRRTIVSCSTALFALALGTAAFATGRPAAPTAPARPAAPPTNTRPTAPPATPPAAKPADPAAGAEAAMMEAWTKYMTLGPQHAMMLKSVGDWELDVSHTPMPGAPASTSKASAKIEPAMGGRYVIERVRGEVMGSPFEGMGVTGFDNALKKVVMSWIDSMGTGIMNGSGPVSADGKTITIAGQMVDPSVGKLVPFRQVFTIVDDNNRKLEMFNIGPDNKEFKAMEIIYKRKGAAAPATTAPAAPAARPPAAPATPAKPN